jgi:hypothetical protein
VLGLEIRHRESGGNHLPACTRNDLHAVNQIAQQQDYEGDHDQPKRKTREYRNCHKAPEDANDRHNYGNPECDLLGCTEFHIPFLGEKTATSLAPYELYFFL